MQIQQFTFTCCATTERATAATTTTSINVLCNQTKTSTPMLHNHSTRNQRQCTTTQRATTAQPLSRSARNHWQNIYADCTTTQRATTGKASMHNHSTRNRCTTAEPLSAQPLAKHLCRLTTQRATTGKALMHNHSTRNHCTTAQHATTGYAALLHNHSICNLRVQPLFCGA